MRLLAPDREDRFWAKVDKTGDCWLWTGALDKQGYGHVAGQRAHRVTYAAIHGPIPPGSDVHHRCETRACVNPAHLELKGRSEHLRDHKRATIAKLTVDQVNEIRRRLATGELQLALAQEFGVSGRAIWQICSDVRWRDDPKTPRQKIEWERYCPECGVQVTGRHSKRFCCRQHRSVYGQRRRRLANA